MANAQSEATAADARIQRVYGEAKAAEASGDLAGAAANYESLLQIAPRLAPAYNNPVSLYLRQRKYNKPWRYWRKPGRLARKCHPRNLVHTLHFTMDESFLFVERQR